ncbi:MAG: helix-turn-helix domain-containing protein [Pseudomonadales bacterium]|nr:helix-turn-helix domain-containing protein [Pseudomonadales bacterium]
MSFKAMAWASGQRLPAAKKSLLYTVANFAGPDGRFWPSYQRLADDAGLSRRSVMKFMAEFEAAGMVRKVRRRKGNGESDTNLFLLVIDNDHGAMAAPARATCSPDGDGDSPGEVNGGHPGEAPGAPKTVTEPVRQPVRKTESGKLELDLSSLPEGVSQELVQAFIEHRKSLRAPLSQRALALCLGAAETAPTYGLTPTEVIEETIMNGWRKPEPAWVARRRSPGGSPRGGQEASSGGNGPRRRAMPVPARVERRSRAEGESV